MTLHQLASPPHRHPTAQRASERPHDTPKTADTRDKSPEQEASPNRRPAGMRPGLARPLTACRGGECGRRVRVCSVGIGDRHRPDQLFVTTLGTNIDSMFLVRKDRKRRQSDGRFTHGVDSSRTPRVASVADVAKVTPISLHLTQTLHTERHHHMHAHPRPSSPHIQTLNCHPRQHPG